MTCPRCGREIVYLVTPRREIIALEQPPLADLQSSADAGDCTFPWMIHPCGDPGRLLSIAVETPKCEKCRQLVGLFVVSEDQADYVDVVDFNGEPALLPHACH